MTTTTTTSAAQYREQLNTAARSWARLLCETPGHGKMAHTFGDILGRWRKEKVSDTALIMAMDDVKAHLRAAGVNWEGVN